MLAPRRGIADGRGEPCRLRKVRHGGRRIPEIQSALRGIGVCDDRGKRDRNRGRRVRGEPREGRVDAAEERLVDPEVDADPRSHAAELDDRWTRCCRAEQPLRALLDSRLERDFPIALAECAIVSGGFDAQAGTIAIDLQRAPWRTECRRAVSRRVGREQGPLEKLVEGLVLAVAGGERVGDHLDDHVRAKGPYDRDDVADDRIAIPVLQDRRRVARKAEVVGAREELFRPVDPARGECLLRGIAPSDDPDSLPPKL